MSTLGRLANLLSSSVDAPSLPEDTSIDAVLAGLQRHARAGTSASVPEDLQQQAVRRFWETQRFDSLKDARLVSFGLCVPSRPEKPCIMEDRQRFQAVLDHRTGVEQWVNNPRWYRRCYQGLVRSYFTYDPKAEKTPDVGRQNWGDLRDYLHEHTRNIVDEKANPDWVRTAVDHRQLFGDEPCAPYAAAVLSGDTSTVDYLCAQLGVIKASWFLRELVLAQVREATKLSHERFKERIPTLVTLLEDNRVLRDRGLILMLDKYASVAQPAIDEPLRNAAVEWWGNPWLPSNEMRWGGVVPKAREMVAEWLKREFIEAFFTKLAEDGVGDRRRANFWLRYAKSMENIQFALGARALYSTDRDFVVLRQKMKGLYTELKTTDSSNNAFVMTMGSLVAVEFGGKGNAFYGYDKRMALPFDMSKPVVTTRNARNSLKHDQRILWMQHQDGIRGYDKWEKRFEATLREKFGIRPNAASLRVSARAVPLTAQPAASSQPVSRPPPAPTPASVGAFSISSLASWAQARNLAIDDRSDKNGNLWVRTDDSDQQVNAVLRAWHFKYRPGKGWWR
ncbi:MAG: EH signature domain-containing protein [Immundisolibacter sp.]|uniref:EH signature domain-containing protein n=1 Tax=Immundisolibacter sp. TaxID=1934948 RepID=UPI003D0F5434